MPTLNEVKEQMVVVRSVGDFTNALQQIATMRMMKLRGKVLKSRPFVEAANGILSELISLRNEMDKKLISRLPKEKVPTPHNNRRAVIVITSNQGLSGPYNIEIYKMLNLMIEEEKGSDFYVIGKKGQEYFAHGKYPVEHFPYEVPDNFTIEDLKRLINTFDYYDQLTLVYSRFINTATRDVVAVSIVNPVPETPVEDKKGKKDKNAQPTPTQAKPTDEKPKPPTEADRQPGRFTFEPNIDDLIEGVSKKLRAALFQQQIFDARLSQFAAQMIGMQTASDNAIELLADLRLEYNKQRRKMIDKKISEVFAGSATWQS